MRTIILVVLCSSSVFGQAIKEKELKTTIQEVTVFLSGAQIFESGSVMLAAGKSLLRVRNVSPYIDEKSIQVKAEGEFTVLSVNHKYNYLEALKNDEAVDSLRNLRETIESGTTIENARLEVLKEKQGVLNHNKDMGGTANGVSIVALKQALDFYDQQITAIKSEEIRIEKSIARKTLELEKIDRQLTELQEQRILPGSEIEIRVESEAACNGKFTITYMVANAGWFPKYDVRVENISSPLQMNYKAEVFQNTGVDWKNVKLRFSNGSPNQTGVVPELKTWMLSYARNTRFDKSSLYGSRSEEVQNAGSVRGRVVDSDGRPMAGLSVIVKGTSIGTVTDANGNYSLTLPRNHSTLVFSFVGYSTREVPIAGQELNVEMQEDIQQLSEVVVTGYGLQGKMAGVNSNRIRIRGTSSLRGYDAQPIITTFVENQTTVEIEVAMPYTIKSDGEKLMIDLKQYAIQASYQYYAVPKLDKDAFLVARIVDWDQYNLLEGEANLYFEDAFVGRSVLNARVLTDTLTISLGRDKNIVVGRTKVDQFSKKKILASNRVETRAFKILVRNKKSQPVKLTIFDQMPVSIVNDIIVEAIDVSHAAHDTKTGELTWELDLKPQEQKEFSFQYEVKYPRRESVVLE